MIKPRVLTGRTDYRGDWSALTRCVKCMLNHVLPLCWIVFLNVSHVSHVSVYSNNLGAEMFPQVLSFETRNEDSAFLCRAFALLPCCQQLRISEGKLGWNSSGDIWSDNYCVVLLQRLSSSDSSVKLKWPSQTIKALQVLHIWSAKWPLATGSSAVWLQGMRRQSIYARLAVI